MSRLNYVIQLVATITGNREQAVTIVERLQEEGFLHVGYGSLDVNTIVEQFQATFGTTKVSQNDRYAAQRLANKYSPQAIAGMIRELGKATGQRYCPVVNNVSELENKFVSILNFLRERGVDDTIKT